MINVILHTMREKWNTVVKSFPNWDIYYLCEYAESLMHHGDGIPNLIYYEGHGLRIAYVVMLSDIADFEPFAGYLNKESYFDYSTPYGYGGPLFDGFISSIEVDQFISELTTYATDHNIVSQFIRFHPLLRNNRPFDSQCHVLYMKKTVFIDTVSPEVICNNINRKNKNVIRKAVKNGISISWDHGENIDAFISIYNQTMCRKNADDYYFFDRQYFAYLVKNMHNNLIVFYASYNDEIIGSSLFLYNEKYMHYHLSGSLEKYHSLGATNYLIYEAAKWASRNGITMLHLGGGVGVADSLFDFKKQFNKNGLVDFCIGGNIFLPEVYKSLINFRKDHDQNFDEAKPYFVKYRSQ